MNRGSGHRSLRGTGLGAGCGQRRGKRQRSIKPDGVEARRCRCEGGGRGRPATGLNEDDRRRGGGPGRQGLGVRGLKLEMAAPWQGVLGGRPRRQGQGVVPAHRAREEAATSVMACGGADPGMGTSAGRQGWSGCRGSTQTVRAAAGHGEDGASPARRGRRGQPWRGPGWRRSSSPVPGEERQTQRGETEKKERGEGREQRRNGDGVGLQARVRSLRGEAGMDRRSSRSRSRQALLIGRAWKTEWS